MGNLLKAARWSFALMLAGLAVQQFFYADFRPVLVPAWPSRLPGYGILVYLVSAALIGIGTAILLEKKARTVALVSGGLSLLLFCFCQIPYELIVDPYSKHHIGVWTNAFKLLALAGGAFIVAGSFPGEQGAARQQGAFTGLLEKFIPFGNFFFCVTMIIFGIDHFLYVGFVASLVPSWIPHPVFWTYFAGAALIGSGLAVILKIRLKLVAILLATMIFLWLIVLHIPRAIADPYTDKGNEVTSVFEALGFSGIAFLMAYGYYKGNLRAMK